METKELQDLLRRAADVVGSADIPDDLRPVAFQEAMISLREEQRSPRDAETKKAPRRPGKSQDKARKAKDTTQSDVPDEGTFFSLLADESGVKEDQLRDVLHLAADGKVQVTPPTRRLGNSVAEQAKNVIALVSVGRSVGLGEQPVSADAVREELERKRCYQSNNFASKHLGPMKGFNAGANKAEIRLASKWVDEFTAAVAKLQEPPPKEDPK